MSEPATNTQPKRESPQPQPSHLLRDIHINAGGEGIDCCKKSGIAAGFVKMRAKRPGYRGVIERQVT